MIKHTVKCEYLVLWTETFCDEDDGVYTPYTIKVAIGLDAWGRYSLQKRVKPDERN